MSLSEPIIKKYTQASCTLQVTERTSGLDRGAKSVNAPIQFEVRFHDSQLPEAEQIRIQGDRHSLVELHEVGKNYVQRVLASSPERFNALLVEDAANTPTLPAELDSSSTPAPAPAGGIYIQPGEGLSHNLFLGALATSSTGQFIPLSMTQLFDLANALDEYAADVLAVPTNFNSPTRFATTPSTAWAGIAAVLLVGVGLTAGLVHLLNRSDEPQTASRPPQQPSASPTLSPEAVPSVPPTSDLPSPTTSPTLTSPTLGNLPNTPSVGSSPTIPSPLSDTTLPTAPTTPPFTTTAPPVPPNAGASPLPGIAQAPSGSTQTPKQSANQPANKPAVQPDSLATLPGITTNNNLPSPPTPDRSAQTPPTIDVPAAPPSNPAPPPSVEGLTPRERIRAALEGKPVEEPPAKPSRQAPQAAAFAPTPQVNEVREYFQQRWQPPSGLSEPLEYSIVLDVDGSVQRIEPLGKAARNYIESSGLPLIGEPFVSANPQGETPRVRVILGADGKVQSFLEQN
ncbi:MAG: hypothetical protein N4J56_001793 [Chroococcidiopsis sp. SAG 2025]|uniref:DUF4335 domain-containing protein n=1 Tax=Chroococcidiopsis sp. SAG 2025 TaxID=171389 RepID=UPI00293725A5|nr:DUF4335 domain-containing protein [Chroococcidiopsis sp. SAG 2025]MDV2992139.1 hypothetical protein [Chroococcidiopsis sp. SAG 2025]